MADQTTPAPAPQPGSPPPSAPAETQTAPQPQPADQDERFFAALGYFAFLFVIPLLVKPKSPFCKFHARQSMVLFAITLVVFFVLYGFPLVGSLFTLALFAIYILAIYRAYKGEWWSIPFVSKFAGRINVESLYGKAGLAVSGLAGLKEKAQGLAEKAGEGVKSMGKQEEGPTPSATAGGPPQTPPPAPPAPPPQPPSTPK